MIDDKGRILGWINLIDLLVILLIAGVIAGAYYRTAVMAPARVGQTQTITTLVEIPEVRDFTVDRIQAGSQLAYNDTGITYGTITQVEVMPAFAAVETADGEIVQTELPNRYDVHLVIESTGTVSPSAVMIGPEEIRIGSEFLLKTRFIRVLGRVLSIEFQDEGTQSADE